MEAIEQAGGEQPEVIEVFERRGEGAGTALAVFAMLVLTQGL